MCADQLSISGGTGTLTPTTFKFPGEYAATDPGILFNVHQAVTSYIAPGGDVVEGGVDKTPSANPTCPAAGSSGAKSGGSTGGAATKATTSAAKATTLKTSTKAAAATVTAAAAGGGLACSVAKFQQCGGTGYTGCTVCAVS